MSGVNVRKTEGYTFFHYLLSDLKCSFNHQIIDKYIKYLLAFDILQENALIIIIKKDNDLPFPCQKEGHRCQTNCSDLSSKMILYNTGRPDISLYMTGYAGSKDYVETPQSL